MRQHLHFDGMCWPNPDDPNEVEYRLIHGQPTKEDLLVAASFMAAYRQLVWLPTKTCLKRKQQIKKAVTEGYKK